MVSKLSWSWNADIFSSLTQVFVSFVRIFVYKKSSVLSVEILSEKVSRWDLLWPAKDMYLLGHGAAQKGKLHTRA